MSALCICATYMYVFTCISLEPDAVAQAKQATLNASISSTFSLALWRNPKGINLAKLISFRIRAALFVEELGGKQCNGLRWRLKRVDFQRFFSYIMREVHITYRI
jgi:hypothetical protein